MPTILKGTRWQLELQQSHPQARPEQAEWQAESAPFKSISQKPYPVISAYHLLANSSFEASLRKPGKQ